MVIHDDWMGDPHDLGNPYHHHWMVGFYRFSDLNGSGAHNSKCVFPFHKRFPKGFPNGGYSIHLQPKHPHLQWFPKWLVAMALWLFQKRYGEIQINVLIDFLIVFSWELVTSFVYPARWVFRDAHPIKRFRQVLGKFHANFMLMIIHQPTNINQPTSTNKRN